MPWLSIVAWLVTYLLSSSQGNSAGKSALLATGAAVGTYLLADPANENNFLGIGQGTPTSDDAAGNPSSSGTSSGGAANWATLGTSAIKTAGDVVTSPYTAGTIAATGAATGSGVFKSENLPWLLGALGLILLIK